MSSTLLASLARESGVHYMNWPIKKTIDINGVGVSVTVEREITPDHRTVLKATATHETVEYSERMSLPHDNHSYSQEQAQVDFDAFLLKVARGALGRHVSKQLSDNLK